MCVSQLIAHFLVVISCKYVVSCNCVVDKVYQQLVGYDTPKCIKGQIYPICGVGHIVKTTPAI